MAKTKKGEKGSIAWELGETKVTDSQDWKGDKSTVTGQRNRYTMISESCDRLEGRPHPYEESDR